MFDRGAAPKEIASKVDGSWARFAALLSPDPVDMLPSSSSSETWTNWIDHSIKANEAGEWSALSSALEHIATQRGMVDEIRAYLEWVDVVERYLFDTALVEVTRTLEPASTDGV